MVFIFIYGVCHSAQQSPSIGKIVTTYGGKIPTEGKILKLKAAIEQLEKTQQPTTQKISGTITKVCRFKGCWMIMVDGDQFARITFKDYGFFVPRDTAQKHSVIFGILSERTLSVSQAQHYAEDEGQPPNEVTQSQKEYFIVADAVTLEDI